MKPLEELSEEELADILTIQRGDTTFYTSKISKLTPSYVVYDNVKHDITATNGYLAFKEAKKKYEYYKFFYTKQTIEDMVDDTLQKHIEHKYIKRMEDMTNNYSTALISVIKRLNNDSKGLDTLSETLSDNFRTFNRKLAELTELAENTVPSKLTTSMDKLVQDTKHINDDIKKELRQVSSEFTGVVNNLKSLFS